uniref:HELICc2 domain-containing protein n=1 Tax=Gongylonema pulchrum TaxID=637853 RepID=A0A183EW81_9BILA
LQRYVGVCEDHVRGYTERTARLGLLWFKQTKKRLSDSDEPKDKVTKLAIGVEGGFCSGPKYEIENEYAIVVHPHFKTKYSINRFFTRFSDCCINTMLKKGGLVTNFPHTICPITSNNPQVLHCTSTSPSSLSANVWPRTY